MMAASTAIEVSHGELSEPSVINFDKEVKNKIIHTLEALPFQDGESVLVLFWAAKEIGDATVLTITSQPFRLYGNNKELQDYYLACLDHKLYVYRSVKEEAAFGLSGWVYLYCTPQQTQDVHAYPEANPACEDAIFNKKWGSFGVPVIDTNKCVGVLEFVIDTPRDYDDDILVVQRLLESAGLQTSIQIDRTIRTYLYPKKMIRKSKSFNKVSYRRLAPLFGMNSACAAKTLKVKPGTFRNICRRVGISEWPCLRKTRDTSISKAKINKMIVEPRDRDEGFFESSLEQTITIDSNALLPERVGPSFMANHAEMEFDDKYAPSMGYLEFMDDKFPIWDEGFLEPSLEQTISQALLPEHCGSNVMANHGENEHHDNYAPSMESDVWFPELAGLDSLVDLGKMEYPGNNAPDYLNSMNDEEMNIIGHQKGDLNSIRGKRLSEWSLEQTKTTDSDVLAELGGTDSDDTWIAEMIKEMQQEGQVSEWTCST